MKRRLKIILKSKLASLFKKTLTSQNIFIKNCRDNTVWVIFCDSRFTPATVGSDPIAKTIEHRKMTDFMNIMFYVQHKAKFYQVVSDLEQSEHSFPVLLNLIAKSKFILVSINLGI